jgi:hypothetical protein
MGHQGQCDSRTLLLGSRKPLNEATRRGFAIDDLAAEPVKDGSAAHVDGDERAVGGHGYGRVRADRTPRARPAGEAGVAPAGRCPSPR